MKGRRLLLLALACVVGPACVTHAVRKPPNPICLSAVADVCSTLEDLGGLQGAVTALHDKQMKRWDALLAELSAQLAEPELYPLPVVELKQPKTKHWKDPTGSYAVRTSLRLYYDKGRDRYQAFPKLQAAMEALRAYGKEAKKEWKRFLKAQPRKVRIPDRILRERDGERIVFSAGKVIAAVVPGHLARKHWRTEQGQAHAVMGLVVTEGDLAYKIVEEHSVPIDPAFTRSKMPLLGYRISESPARKLVFRYTTSVSYEHLCKEFRAELRFVPAGEVAQRAWAVRNKAPTTAGGGR